MSVWDRLGRAAQAVGAAGTDTLERLRTAVGSGPEARQAAVSMAVVALAAKMAKADGVVMPSEATSFWQRFDIAENDRGPIGRLFDLAQRDVAGFEAYAQKVVKMFPGDFAIREDILDILFTIAASDGLIHEAELAYLDRVAAIFGVDQAAWDRIRARHLAPDGDPYTVLGLTPDADRDAIVRRYRALVLEHHPDRLIARGVPAEFVRVATDRLASINAAYDAVLRRVRA